MHAPTLASFDYIHYNFAFGFQPANLAATRLSTLSLHNHFVSHACNLVVQHHSNRVADELILVVVHSLTRLESTGLTLCSLTRSEMLPEGYVVIMEVMVK